MACRAEVKKFIQMLVIVLLFFVPQLSAKNKSLAELRKETIYVLVPSYWPDSSIAQVFGKIFQKLDTGFKTINTTVHRIAIDEDLFGYLPSVEKYYPDVEELVLGVYLKEAPDNIINFSRLRSIKEVYNCAGSLYISDDTPMPGPNFDVPDILLRSGRLEEASFVNSPLFVPEQLSEHATMKLGIGGLPMLPFFLLQKKNNVSLCLDDPEVPYPEILAMSYTGFSFKDHSKTWYDEEEWITNGLDLYDYDYSRVPFWFEGDSLAKRPKPRSLPRNGYYSTSYFNGTNIINGNMVDGKPDGEWKWFYPDGKLCELRNYDHGKENGKWAILDPNGDTTRNFTFDEGKMINEGYFENHREYDRDDSSRISYSIREWIFDLRTSANTIVEESYRQHYPWDTLTHITISYCDTAKWKRYTPVKVIIMDYYNGIQQSKKVVHVINDSLDISESYDRNNRLVLRTVPFAHLMRTQYYPLGFPVIDSTIDSAWYVNGDQKFVRSTRGRRIRETNWDSTGSLLLEADLEIMYNRDTLKGKFEYYADGKLSRTIEYKSPSYKTITKYDEQGRFVEMWEYTNGFLSSRTEYKYDGNVITITEYNGSSIIQRVLHSE